VKTFIFSLVFLFGLLSLAPNLQGAQFLKLNELISHYCEHQSGPESFGSFLEFIKDHYYTKDHKGENESQMPFKSTQLAFNYCITLENTFLNLPQKMGSFQEPKQALFDNPQSAENRYMGLVWNPPRMS
jgi:hypothetical protein